MRNKAKDEKKRWTITQTANGRNFIFRKLSVIDFFLSERRYGFIYTANIGPWQIFQLSIFALSREKYCYQSDCIRSLQFLFSYLFYFGFYEILNDTVFWKYEFFCALSSHNQRKSDKRPWISWQRSSFTIHLLTWHSWLAISKMCKKLS